MPDAGALSLRERLAQARVRVAAGEARPVASSSTDGVGATSATAWDAHPAIRRIAEQKAALEQLGLPNPYGRPHETVSADTLRVDGRQLLNFSGYNYLGLSGHPEVAAAAKAAIDRYGTSCSASRLAAGELLLHGELEREIAAMLGVPAALVFNSGYGTNVTTIAHLFGPGDLVVHDSLAHSSIMLGCQLSGSRRLAFPHNDVAALDRLLAEHRPNYERVLIVVEGVYSMDGDVAPLPELITLKQRHRALLMVDEAHSIGVLGDRGGGIGEHFGVDRTAVDIWMGTLSKTLASCGGYVAGETAMVDCLRYTAPGFIYSVGLTPPDTAAALAALRLMQREPERVRRVRDLAAQFVAAARARGLNTGASAGSAVVPVILGSSILTMRLAAALFEAGINVHPMIYPAVEESAARLRFFITASHTPEQLHIALDTVAATLEQLRVTP